MMERLYVQNTFVFILCASAAFQIIGKCSLVDSATHNNGTIQHVEPSAIETSDDVADEIGPTSNKPVQPTMNTSSLPSRNSSEYGDEWRHTFESKLKELIKREILRFTGFRKDTSSSSPIQLSTLPETTVPNQLVSDVSEEFRKLKTIIIFGDEEQTPHNKTKATHDVNDGCSQSSSPCQNGGTCGSEGGSYVCVCVNGWTGRDCAVNINDCAVNPCFNGGTCQDRLGSYTCVCPLQKTGLRCQLDDACQSNPCPASSLCTTSPLDGTFFCTCLPGWTGSDCDVDINECDKSATCEHGGRCSNTPGSFKCSGCSYGYTGQRCETNINDCTSSSCENGCTCVDEIGYFVCVCLDDQTTPILQETRPEIVSIANEEGEYISFDLEGLRSHMVMSAELWLYVTNDVTSLPLDAVSHSNKTIHVVWTSRSVRGELRSSGEVIRRRVQRQDGWISLNVRSAVRSWLRSRRTHSHRSTVKVVCQGGCSVSLSSDQQVPHQPYLKITTRDSRPPRRERSISDVNGDTANTTSKCCEMRSLEINFEVIGWHQILAPRSFMANYCYKSCKAACRSNGTTDSESVSSHTRYPCSPTSMSPMTLVHYDSKGAILMTTFSEFLVESCGCT